MSKLLAAVLLLRSPQSQSTNSSLVLYPFSCSGQWQMFQQKVQESSLLSDIGITSSRANFLLTLFTCLCLSVWQSLDSKTVCILYTFFILPHTDEYFIMQRDIQSLLDFFRLILILLELASLSPPGTSWNTASWHLWTLCGVVLISLF